MSAETEFMAAIFKGDLTQVKGLAGKVNLNYQLTLSDIAALKSTLGVPEGVNYGLEEGMTPLLLALSLERLSIANHLLTSYHDKVDVNLTNAIGVTPLHMLIMVAIGDERYNQKGEDTAKVVPKGPVQEQVAQLASALCQQNAEVVAERLAPNTVSKGVNYLTEAIFHEHLAMAEVLRKHGSNAPSHQDEYNSIQRFYINGVKSPEESMERLHAVVTLFSTGRGRSDGEIRQGMHLFKRGLVSFPLTSAAHIKEMLRSLYLDKCDGGGEQPAVEPIIKLLTMHRQVAEEQGLSIEGKAFAGAVRDGFLKDLPDPIKQALLTFEEPVKSANQSTP